MVMQKLSDMCRFICIYRFVYDFGAGLEASALHLPDSDKGRTNIVAENGYCYDIDNYIYFVGACMVILFHAIL